MIQVLAWFFQFHEHVPGTKKSELLRLYLYSYIARDLEYLRNSAGEERKYIAVISMQIGSVLLGVVWSVRIFWNPVKLGYKLREREYIGLDK